MLKKEGDVIKKSKFLIHGSVRYDSKYNGSIEKDRKRVPTDKDYKDTYKILKSFHIDIAMDEIPKFNAMYELYNWRIAIIKKYL